MTPPDPDWRTLNRANWDERTQVHLGPRGYDLSRLRAGLGRLPLVEPELGPVAGLKILHLQCHIGTDSLALAQRGATVVGLDFSPEAIRAARNLARELGLSGQASFVESDVYEARTAIPHPASFDAVFVTWGALCWLPDIKEWTRIVAHFLHSGGFLYLAEGHSAALVFDDRTGADPGRPGFYWPYLARQGHSETDERDYADPEARLRNATTQQWLHPLGDVVTAILDAGLQLEWLHEHDAIPWRMFECLVESEEGVFRWPDQPWLPLAYSLCARKP